jgi:isocitrate dehydrogenase (NAD+)
MRIGLVKGNGIGPEIVAATRQVLDATDSGLEWIDVPVAEEATRLHGHPLPPESLQRLREVKFAIKGPIIVEKLAGRITCTQSDGSEHAYPSINNALRRELGLFVSPRRLAGFSGRSGRYAEMDVVVMRELTEDIYVGWEHRVGDDVGMAIKLTTRAAATRVARFSFDYARANKRRRVTCVHKANVLGVTDGLFLTCCREVAREYPDIVFDDCMIDAACYGLVRTPEKFDVIVTANQYGDILSDLAAGLVGSLGLAPGGNIGSDAAVFEACHGAAPDIAGKGIANPIALILSGAMLLRHIGQAPAAERVERAVRAVVTEGVSLTPDLDGRATTQALTDAICARIRAPAVAS